MARAQATTTTGTETGNTGAAKAAKVAAKAAKEAAKAAQGKPNDSYIQRTFRSASQAERCLQQWVDRWGSYASLDPKAKQVAEDVATALNQIRVAKDSLEKLHRSGWEPPKLAGGQALPLQANTQVWITKEHLPEYAEVFDAADLDGKLFVDKVVAGKMVIRIGDAKAAKARFFVPKSHLTTSKPQ